MSMQLKTRATAGVAAVITGVLLVGASGLTLVVGWALWAIGVVVLMTAVPASAERTWTRRREARTQRYSLVR